MGYKGPSNLTGTAAWPWGACGKATLSSGTASATAGNSEDGDQLRPVCPLCRWHPPEHLEPHDVPRLLGP